MSNEERARHWEQIYGEKSPLEVSWFQQEPTLSLKLIEQTTPTDTPLIDIGGGSSTLIDHLLQRGYHDVAVLDISANALSHTRERLGVRAEHVEWIVSDITRFSPQRQYALWHDRAVFHFLTDAADRRAYVSSLKQALQPGGHLIIAAFIIGGPTMCSGLDIVQYSAEKLSAELGSDFTLLEQHDELHTTPSGGEQAFCYYLYRY